jgi:subtilisin family serine protease
MNFQRLCNKIVILIILLSPLSASALVMRANGPEPIIVQIKESLRTSDDLDNQLKQLATIRQQNKLTVVKWWAGPKLLVLVSFPANFTEKQATDVVAKLQACSAVEQVVAVSAFNLHFRSGDFVREYGPNDTIPDVARRGFDADRIGKPAYVPPDDIALLQTPHVPNRLIVGWKEENVWESNKTGFDQKMADLHHRMGCRVVNEFHYSPTKLHQVLEFDDPSTLAAKLKGYMDSGYVLYAQPDNIYKTADAFPNDPAYQFSPGPQWTLPLIKAPQAWGMTTGDRSVVIAVGDTGANVSHPDFINNIWGGQNHNFVSNSANVDDDNGHGSNVASIIGAEGNNGSYMTGVAWNTSLMILKVSSFQGITTTSTIASALTYAWQNGATAMNLSLGFKDYADCQSEGGGAYDCIGRDYADFEKAAIRDARDHDMVVVASAGNDGESPVPGGTPPNWKDGTLKVDNDDDLNRMFPASVPFNNVISVLATGPNDYPTRYTCYGASRVDLGAPGGTDASPVMGLRQNFNGNSSDPSNYFFDYGTSQAAPHVTGALALIKSLFPWENYLGLRDRVLMGTERTGTLEGLCRTNGRLNVYKALQTRSMLRNLSTRARVEGGDRVMIAGFVIGGSANGPALKVGIRGLGPSLQGTVNAAVLGNPRIELHDGFGTLIDANNNWADDWNAAETTASGLQPSDSNEAAMVRWLNPGAYTVVLSDEGTQYGVGLFEIYELQGNANEQSRLVNLSTRCLVGTGDEQAFAGTLVGDFNNTGLPKPDRRLLIFGKGPSLAAFHVQGALSDPQLSASNGEYNDNWASIGVLGEELSTAQIAPTNPLESVLWPTFAPASGNTVILSGANGATGIGLIEFYEQ